MSDWKNTASMVSNKIKQQLHSRKTDHFDIINQWIYKFDPQNTGLLPRYEFEQFLGKIGVFLSTQELRCLYNQYSVKSIENPKQLVSYAEIIENIKVDISEYRLSIIKNAWQFLDQNQQGKLSIQEIIDRYQSSQHPRVRTREKTQEQVKAEFENAIVQKSEDQQFITEREFLNYYSDLNLTLQNEKDEYFADLIFKTWGITSGENYVSPQRLNDLQMILYEKIRQKTFTKVDEGNTAKNTFKYFDLADTGCINYEQFCKALNTFGCIFEERELQALFTKFDLDQSGKINYYEFSKLFASLGSGFYPNTNPIYDELKKLPQEALNKIGQGLQQKGISKDNIQERFQRLDSQQSGYLDREAFQSVLIKEGIILSKPENDSIYRHFDQGFKDQLPYNEIISYL